MRRQRPRAQRFVADAALVAIAASALAGCQRTRDIPTSAAVKALPPGQAVTIQAESGYHIEYVDGKSPAGETSNSRIVKGMLSNSNWSVAERTQIAPGRRRLTLAYQNGYAINHLWIEHDFVAGHAYFVGAKNAFDVKTVKLSDATAKRSWLIETGSGRHAANDAP